MKFKMFSDSNFGRLENAVNSYLAEHNISRDSIVYFKVSYDDTMHFCTVSILYKQ